MMLVNVTPPITKDSLIGILYFLYSGTLPWNNIALAQCSHILYCAKLYGINLLVQLLEHRIQTNLDGSSVHPILRLAVDFKDTRLKQICMDWIASHNNEFVTSKEGIQVLGLELFQQTVLYFANEGKNHQPLKVATLEGDTIVEDFARLYDTIKASADVMVSIRGEYVKFHKCIWANQSAKMAQLLNLGIPGKDGIDAINNWGYRTFWGALDVATFQSLLKFCYYGEKNIMPLEAAPLIRFAVDYEVPILRQVCRRSLGRALNAGKLDLELVAGILVESHHLQDTQTEKRAIKDLKKRMTTEDAKSLKSWAEKFKCPPIATICKKFV